MALSLLEIVQAVMGESGFGTTSSAAGSYNSLVTQIVSLANSTGRQIARQYNWQTLTYEYRFTTEYDDSQTGTLTNGSAVITDLTDTSGLGVYPYWYVRGAGIPQDTYIISIDSGTQITLTRPVTADGSAVSISFEKAAYDLPDYFSRLVNTTEWDKTNQWPMLGPATSDEWQTLVSGISAGFRVRFRLAGAQYEKGNLFMIFPTISANNYYGFEYISSAWARSSSGDFKEYFDNDNDYCVFPDDVMILGTKLKILEAKALDATAAKRDYDHALSTAFGQNAGSRKLSMSGKGFNEFKLIGNCNLPDTGYGQ